MDFLLRIFNIFISSLSYATPIIFAGMGGLYSETSGVVNVGLEGMMVMGAFGASLVVHFLGPALGSTGMIIAALIIAGALGAVFALLHSLASVSYDANQIISGTALNMLSVSLGVFIVKLLFEGKAESPGSATPYNMYIDIFGRRLNWGFILITMIVLATYLLLKYTKLGLRIKAVGENPSSVDSAGISVKKLRYGAVVFGGFLAGVGGALAVLTFSNGRFSALSISGLGFLGLASLVFGKWKPWGVFGAAIFFGFSRNMSETVVSNFPQIINYVPGVLLKILPYLLTIIALMIFSRSAVAPESLGDVYDQGER